MSLLWQTDNIVENGIYQETSEHATEIVVCVHVWMDIYTNPEYNK